MSKLELIARVPEADKHKSDVEGVTAHGGKLFTCADDGQVKVFDYDLKLIKEFKAHDCAVYDLIVVGDTLFTCSLDTTIKTWDINTFELKKTIEKHEQAVRKFCTDGTLIYAGDERGAVRGYSPDGEFCVLYNVVEEVCSLFAKNTLLYSVRDRGVTITQMKGKDNRYIHCKSLEGRGPLYVDGDWLVFPDSTGLVLQVHDSNKDASFALKGTLKGPDMIITALGGYGDKVIAGGWDCTLRVWDLSKMAEVAKCSIKDVPYSITVTEEGDVFAAGIGGFICKLKCT